MDKEVKRLILWSDSCVPQNRNSIMTMALKKFMEEYPLIEEIVQKYCEPGHSAIQEIDNIHSQTEKYLKGQEIFSPLGLLRFLPQVNQRNTFKVCHLKPTDFKEFKEVTVAYNFKNVPYASVKQLKYLRKEPMKIYFKKDHGEETFSSEDIGTGPTRRKGLSDIKIVNLPTLKICTSPKQCLLPLAKVIDLIKLLKFMPPVDVEFIKLLFKEHNTTKNLKRLQKVKEKEQPVKSKSKIKYAEYDIGDVASTSGTNGNKSPKKGATKKNISKKGSK